MERLQPEQPTISSRVTKIARAMITRFGMSDEFGMMALETNSNMYLGGDSTLICSSKTGELVDRK